MWAGWASQDGVMSESLKHSTRQRCARQWIVYVNLCLSVCSQHVGSNMYTAVHHRCHKLAACMSHNEWISLKLVYATPGFGWLNISITTMWHVPSSNQLIRTVATRGRLFLYQLDLSKCMTSRTYVFVRSIQRLCWLRVFTVRRSYNSSIANDIGRAIIIYGL